MYLCDYLCLCHIFILPHKYIADYYNVNSKVNKIRAHDNEINNSKKIKPKKNHPQSINIRNTAVSTIRITETMGSIIPEKG